MQALMLQLYIAITSFYDFFIYSPHSHHLMCVYVSYKGCDSLHVLHIYKMRCRLIHQLCSCIFFATCIHRLTATCHNLEKIGWCHLCGANSGLQLSHCVNLAISINVYVRWYGPLCSADFHKMTCKCARRMG